jgi:hypothetical protein
MTNPTALYRRSKLTWTLRAIVLVIGSGRFADGQTTLSPDAIAESIHSERALSEYFAKAVVAPMLLAPNVTTQAAAGTQVTFAATKDGTNATASLKLAGSRTWQSEIRLGGPIDKKSGVTDVLTTDGLPGFYTLDAGITRVFNLPLSFEKARQRLERLNTARLHELAAAGPSAERLEAEKAFGDSLEIQGTGLPPMFLTLRGTYGRQQFEFADASTLADRKESLNAWGGTVSFGSYVYNGPQTYHRQGEVFECAPEGGRPKFKCQSTKLEPDRPKGVYAAVTAQYSSSYSDQPQRDICTAVTPQVSKCQSLAFGTPSHKAGWKGQAEWRWDSDLPVSIGGRVTRDWQTPATRVEIPVYFMTKTRTFTGGLSPYWKSRAGSTKASAGIAFFIGGTLPDPIHLQ